MKNNNLDGVIPVNKDKGMTSHDVVAKLRRVLGMKKIGHTGTLDPDVTGVLPICLGKATRISEYIMEMPKTYEGQLTIGISTDTQDFSGEILEKKKVPQLTKGEVEETINSFIGEIEQTPPMYSAVKVKGKKLYELAREGKEIERKSRKVTIYDIQINDMNLELEYPTVDFKVTCSKGTYIRTLCYDIGIKLGYTGYMSKLRRTKSGPFTIDESFTINEIEDFALHDIVSEKIVSMADALPMYEKVVVSDEDKNTKVFNGQRLLLHTYLSYDGIIKIVDNTGNLIGLYEKKENEANAQPIKVFK